jgi:hypothetical protein
VEGLSRPSLRNLAELDYRKCLLARCANYKQMSDDCNMVAGCPTSHILCPNGTIFSFTQLRLGHFDPEAFLKVSEFCVRWHVLVISWPERWSKFLMDWV